jgi:hypothetical protein
MGVRVGKGVGRGLTVGSGTLIAGRVGGDTFTGGEIVGRGTGEGCGRG